MRKVQTCFFKTFYIVSILCFGTAGAQSVSQQLQKAFREFESDSQLKHAISSLYVIEAGTGRVVFDKNSQVGMAPASTQKIITSATAFELLGKDYRYKTDLGYDGTIGNGVLKGSLYVIGSGDPTLGSWRWKETVDTVVLEKWASEIRKLKITRTEGAVMTNTSKFAFQAIPDGWIWQDIGNYYGAGSYPLNWKENQFALKLSSENKLGGKVKVEGEHETDYMNQLSAAGKGTGDNAYIYYDNSLAGTIPMGERSFSISGAVKDPVLESLLDLSFYLMKYSIQVATRNGSHHRESFQGDSVQLKTLNKIYTHYSPSLDSIIYWFNKRSINLYGEALVKTLAYEKQGYGRTDSGLSILKKYWKERGISEDELNMYDGSGLSPLNRVTTHAQVEVLKYAKTRDWFPAFYHSLPDYNNMRMKSGTISDVKGFCGYHRSRDGKEYIFSFLVNNYSGRTSPLVNKMYKVLDLLK